jgi:mRNA-degrading endonuclease RelE of RelBE toxin-antitoxin system
LKRLVKKHPGFKSAIKKLAVSLSKNPSSGSSLGKKCYKLRLGSPDKGTGKSGGFRLITHVNSKMRIVFLLSIYDKSEVATIRNAEIKRLLEDLY